MYHTLIESPIGDLLLTSDGKCITGLDWSLTVSPPTPAPGSRRDDDLFRQAREQLEAYFAGKRRAFELPLKPEGTAFRLRVWEELRKIPYGEVISYAELAHRIGQPGSGRAVGGANGCNPIPVIVPCHRVIGADGTLTGFGGGLDRKRWLLCHEADVLGYKLHPALEDANSVAPSTRVLPPSRHRQRGSSARSPVGQGG